MNPEYILYVLLLCVGIMVIFGWKQQLFGDLSNMSLALIFIGWMSASGLEFQTGQIRVHGTFLLLAFLTSIFIFRYIQEGELFLFVSISSLFSALFLFMQRLFDFYPFYDFTHDRFVYVFMLSLYTAMMYKEVHKQLALISSGLFIGELLYIKLVQPLTVTFGGLELAVIWWFTLLISRVWSLVGWIGMKWFKNG